VAFVIQQSSDRPLGKPGEGIGYEDIANSVAIEFDTYLNAHYSDPNGSHAAVQSNGTSMNKPWHQPPYQRALQVLPVNLVANVSYCVKVEYTPGALTVYFAADPTNGSTPPTFGAPLITLSPFDLSDLIDLDANGAAWLGITSATGRSSERHYIDAWSIEGCRQSVTSVAFDDAQLGVDVRLQPNPASETVLVTLPEALRAERIVVIDVAGRIVKRFSVEGAATAELQVSDLPTGAYLLRIEGTASSMTVPLSIVR
jgi:hypothetical protein